jgi:HD-GYP domain-containing protein (c-di-GMP phosphodiesterase class II)
LSKDIINKKGKLNPDEYKMIQKHPLHGYKALMKTKELNNIAVIVLQHHERIDGEGYPLGLKGKDINVGARIICVADAFDAMISDRPYRRALTKGEAVQEIKNNMGRQFDEHIATIAIDKVL